MALNSAVTADGAEIGRAQAMQALDYRDLLPRLESVVRDSLADLRARFDVVICEGAGSPAELNLRDRDLANMGLARTADLVDAHLDTAALVDLIENGPPAHQSVLVHHLREPDDVAPARVAAFRQSLPERRRSSEDR